MNSIRVNIIHIDSIRINIADINYILLFIF